MSLPRFLRPQVVHTPVSRTLLLRAIGASLERVYGRLLAEPPPLHLGDLTRRLQEPPAREPAGRRP